MSQERDRNQPETIRLGREVRDMERYLRRLSETKEWATLGPDRVRELLEMKQHLDDISKREQEATVKIITLLGSREEH